MQAKTCLRLPAILSPMHEMSQNREDRQPGRRRRPLPRHARRDRAALEQLVSADRPRDRRGMYLLTAVGITVGFHRLLTHRSFQTPKPLEYTFAVLGSMAVQGPVIAWVADHRKHHAHTDEEGDPHSPHVGHGGGAARCLRRPLARARRLADDRPGPRRLEAVRPRPLRGPGHALHQPPLRPRSSRQPGCSRRSPASRSPARSPAPLPPSSGAGSCASSSSTTSPGASTRSATSSARRRFDTDDHSTNVFWLALPSLGESWHHNHHAFPRSAVARPEALGARPLGADHRDDGAARARPERRSGSHPSARQNAAS